MIRANNSDTSLNEAVALDLLEEAGLASQEAVATSFSVNGSTAVLRLAIEHPDDDRFTAELPERLDVEAFATYLAMMDLIGNSDDIDGPGNNAYLWWDARPSSSPSSRGT